jgi:hypothetical protein
MKKDPKEQPKQLSLDFDSTAAQFRNATVQLRPMGLTLAYSSGPSTPPDRETNERELIISQTVSFARKLSW